MSVQRSVEKRKTERMSDLSFKGMTFIFKVVDLVFPYVGRRIKKFGIGEGMTVVDYGCGPGRYATRLAKLVGETGKVYAIDIHELAIEAMKKKIEKQKLRNIEPILAEGYNSTLPDGVADVVCAIDMFFMIKNPSDFLAELKRIAKNDGTLIIDNGGLRSRAVTKQKILDSGHWDIVEETSDHLKCKPRETKPG
jgi:ubiquinone/menaquinone biosynthesis C-methylase UbiE